ncbi:ATP-binding cassette domain-containing protein [bacterium]|nr:ATP-binding cassette domain-containing protein [bacterium]
MDNLLQLQQGHKAYASKTLFEAASFAINEGEHVGVIGPNGAGKTTLFKILIGEESLDSGSLTRSRKLKLGYLSQHDRWNPDDTVEDFIGRDALTPIWDLKALGNSLGLSQDLYTKKITSLSGGYRMRAKLLHLIGQQPNLMLLDEPTNYLDLETLMVLEKFLQGFGGAFLLISHDREFLRRTTDHILEVEGGEITKFNGNIDDYFEQKELLRTQLEARALSLEEKRKQILDFVARFGAKATKASQAQSRLKSLDKMEKVEVKPLPVSARIKIPPPHRTGKMVLNLKSVSLGYGERTILKNVNLALASGDHLAVVGLNGAGKSTLLRGLAGRLTPLAGTIEPGYEVTLAFFNQHVAEELNPDDTVFKALERKAHPSVLPQEILGLAGSLLFSGDDVQKPVRVLSGGECSRVALGQVLLQRASCLILDEPTNHLDFQTVEALTQSLQAFPGSLIVVSHDRSFISRIGTKILEIHNGQAGTYPGTYDDYVWSLEKGAFATLRSEPGKSPDKASSAKEPPGEEKVNYKEKKKALDRRLKQLDTIIDENEKALVIHQRKIGDINEALTTNPADSASKIQEMGQIQALVDDCERKWSAAVEEREIVLSSIQKMQST